MALTPTLKRVQVAKTTLLLDQPFFGALAYQLKQIEDSTAKTAYTNGAVIAWDPAFVATLTNEQLVAVMAHEVMHCACGHPWRRDARDPQGWNVAADYAINGILKEAGFRLPESALLDAQYAGKHAEWIYDRLPQNQKNGSGNDPSGMGEVRDAPSGDADADAPGKEEWAQLTKQAARAAQAIGKLPAGLKRELDQATNEPVDWRSALRRYIQETTRADYSWQRPNARYIASGLYLPALYSQACGKIVIGVDTSGSIDNVLLAQFAREINAIVEDVQPSSVDVMYCDAEVHRVDSFERGEYVEIKAEGGGGTSFVPVFDKVSESGETPAVLVYLTDMYGTFPDQAPDYPVIWASYSTVDSAPFGDVIPCQ